MPNSLFYTQGHYQINIFRRKPNQQFGSTGENIIFVFQPRLMRLIASLVLLTMLTAPLTSMGQFRKIYLDSDPDTYITGMHFLSVSQGWVASNKWVGYTQDSGHTITKKLITNANVDYKLQPVNLTFGFRISGVYAFSKDSLLVYGDYGFVPAILFSSNQGDTYTLIYHSTLQLSLENDGIQSMKFPGNGNTGYAVESNAILKTTNRGKSWNIIYGDLSSSLFDISFVNTTTGYAADVNKVIKTENGGIDWKRLEMPAGRIGGLSFISENKGWVEIDGNAYYTSDAGNSWTLLNNEFEKVGKSLQFIDDSTGFYGGSTVSKSSDGGRQWEPLPRDNDLGYFSYAGPKLFILDPTHIWSGGGHALLQLTTNGGGSTIPVAQFTTDLSELNTLNKVRLINYSKKGNQYQWFKNATLIATGYNAEYISDRLSIDTIMLMVKKGAYSDTSDIITIDTRENTQQCYAAFTLSADTGTVVLSPGYIATGVKHYWDFGDGYKDSVSISPTHTYRSIGTYTIKHRVYNTIDRCTDSTSNEATIYRTKNCLSPDFTYVADSFYTNNLTFKFSYDQTTEHEPVGNALELIACNWGDGSTTLNFSHEYPKEGYYNTCFQVKHSYTGCISQVCKTVEVKMSDNDADFQLNDWTEGNVEGIAKPNINDVDKRHLWIINGWDRYTTGDKKNFQHFFFPWNYGLRNGVSSNPCSNGNDEVQLDSLHKTITHIVYDLKTTLSDTVTKSLRLRLFGESYLTIKPIPNKDFPWQYKFFLYNIKSNGDSSLLYPTNWTIDSLGRNFQGGNPYGGSSLDVILKGPGRYQIGTFSDRCGTSQIGQFYSILVDVPAMECPVYPPSFTPSVVSAQTPNKIYFFSPDFYTQQELGNTPLWKFGDGDSTTIFTPTHEYRQPGTYTVTLRYTNPNGCFKEVSKVVTIGAPCTLASTISVSRDPVIAAKISFNTIANSGVGPFVYKWMFGNGDSTTEQNPVYFYKVAGSYHVILQTTDAQSCGSTRDTTMVITEDDICNVKTGFQYSVNNDGVQFSNLSSPVNPYYTYQWDLGDGSSSAQQNPSHTYATAGAYLVCLTTARDLLCKGDYCDTVVLNIVKREGLAVFPNPANTIFAIEFESDEARPIAISIYNTSGKQVFLKRKTCLKGSNKEVIDIMSLSKGSYTVRITGLNKILVKTFIKQ